MDILQEIDKQLKLRKQATPENSYAAKLYQGGNAMIADKIREETEELIEAVANQKREDIIYEAADVLFHLHVLLAHKDIPIDEVFNELRRRFGVSGIEEKRRRQIDK